MAGNIKMCKKTAKDRKYQHPNQETKVLKNKFRIQLSNQCMTNFTEGWTLAVRELENRQQP